MRIAIAGAGLMGRWHAYYATRCGAAIAGVSDPNLPETELKRRFRGAAIFQRTEPLLDRVKPQILHVCTPAATHEAIIESALEAGVHLLVEKPLLATAKATQRLVAKAAERGLLLVPVHQYVFQEGAMRTAASLKSIGKPLHMDAVICSAGGAHLRGAQLDELIADMLPHPLSLLDSFFPGMLGAMEWTTLHPANGEWRASGVGRGMSVSILVSLNGRPTESSARLTGTNGTARLDLFHGFAVLEPGGISRSRKITHPFSLASRTFCSASGNLARRFLTREPAYPGLRRLIGLFYEAVRRHSDAPLSADHIIGVARARERLCSEEWFGGRQRTSQG
ncbi:MAG TPA: Gfo/Idh/MocA family oxidoreductase [Bryobacteraceae bacterium]|nr:Gfo/Idh/MocA family oxidoreductase [Bryobacteraceae bacterium]